MQGRLKLTCPERNEVDAVEHHSKDARHIRCRARNVNAEDDEEGKRPRTDEHRDLWSSKVRTSEEPPSEDDGKHGGSRGWDIEELIARQACKAETRRHRRKLPL